MTDDFTRRIILDALYKDGRLSTAAIAVKAHLTTGDARKALNLLCNANLVCPVLDSKGTSMRSWELSHNVRVRRYASRLP